MNEKREAEKKKVTTFGMTSVIIPLIVLAIVVGIWFIMSRQGNVPPEAPSDTRTTVPE